MGDGLATIAAGFLGGPANTTYGENTGVLAVTKVYDPSVLRIAACYAIVLGLFSKVELFSNNSSTCNGWSINYTIWNNLFSWSKTMVDSKLDFSNSRNLIIASLIFVLELQ